MLGIDRIIKFLAIATSIVLSVLAAFLLVQLALDVMRLLQSVPALLAGAAIIPLVLITTVFAFATPVLYRKWDETLTLYPNFGVITGIHLLLIGGAGLIRFRFYMTRLEMTREQIETLLGWSSAAPFRGAIIAGALLSVGTLVFRLSRNRAPG